MKRKVHSFIALRTNLDAILVGAGLILFWRGIWGLMDLYFFPDNALLSYAASAIVGFAILYFDDFQLEEIHSSGPQQASLEVEHTTKK